MSNAKPWFWKAFAIVAVIGLAVAAFLMLGPPQLLAKSERPEFCAKCHVMESQYEAWFHSGAHRRNQCVDCHLPYDNQAAHYVWKSIDGMKDVVVFYSGKVPDPIQISDHGKKTIQANCIRCHEEAVSMIDNQRTCWDCHRRVMHKNVGAVETK